ncbi:MAG: TetR/AcrR family transcriptional regulator [Deltaproteobacteria bacterium]|nr:TetR/AcrR family transcriptional regulator [Deltaproteobacteria bacterium]
MTPRKARARPPRGREAVRAAVLDTAAELFAAKGTANVSIRDIAAHARVNHGLIHRHFGSKEELVRDVFQDLVGKIAVDVGERGSSARELPLSMLLATGESRYFRVLARALLDGVDVRAMQQSFPVIDALTRAAEAAKARGELPDDLDPKLAVAGAVTLGLGWLVFEPFVTAALGLEQDATTLRRDMTTTMLRLLRSQDRRTPKTR